MPLPPPNFVMYEKMVISKKIWEIGNILQSNNPSTQSDLTIYSMSLTTKYLETLQLNLLLGSFQPKPPDLKFHLVCKHANADEKL